MSQPASTEQIHQDRKADFFIFGIALLLRLVALLLSAHATGLQHADGYYEIANNLVNGNGYSYASVAPYFLDSSRTPGLPILLAPFMLMPNGAWVFVVLQVFIGSLIPVLSRRLLRMALPSKLATGAAVALALDPAGILLSIKILSETMFTFFFLLFFYILQRLVTAICKDASANSLYQAVATAGLMLGLATLCRPSTLYLPLITLPFLFLKRMRTKQGMTMALTFIVTFLLCVAPWSLRNLRVYGVGSFSSIKETVLYVELAPSVLAVQNHVDLKTATPAFYASQGFKEQPSISTADAPQFRKAAIAAIKRYPRALLSVFILNITSFSTHDGLLDLSSALGISTHTADNRHIRELLGSGSMNALQEALRIFFRTPILWFAALLRLIWLTLATVCVWGILYRWFKKKFDPLSISCIFVIGYFALTTLSNGLAVNARFRFPINCIIILFALSSILLTRTSRHQPML